MTSKDLKTYAKAGILQAYFDIMDSILGKLTSIDLQVCEVSATHEMTKILLKGLDNAQPGVTPSADQLSKQEGQG
jgi:hypothetical protein